MEQSFLITSIDQVTLVEKERFQGKKITFSNKLYSNELIFHYSGRSSVYFDDTVLQIKPNTIRFLPMGEFKRYEVVRSESSECIDVFFKTDKPISTQAFTIDASSKEHIGKLFKRLFSVWIGKGEGYYFECISILYKIFSEIQRSSYAPSEHFVKIKPAIDQINEGFLSKSLTVPYLASLCRISESYMKRIFKEKYGVSPIKFIIQKKLDYACELLLLNRYTITQIAEMSNFSDVYYFSHKFKEYIGITPKEYVKKYKSSN